MYPHVEEISYQKPEIVFAPFAKQNGSILLDSARLMTGCGRYSFIAIDPFLILRSDIEQGENPFDSLARELARFPLQFHPDMPPFQGGVVGFFSYDLYEHLETIISEQVDDMQFPDLVVGFYDLVIAFDHEVEKAWIFSSGHPECETSLREKKSRERVDWLKQQLNLQPSVNASDVLIGEKNIKTNFSREAYQSAVQKVKEYILAGDIFEANISQRFHADLPKNMDYYDLYLRLRKINPATFAAYLFFDDVVLASASPERFLKLTDCVVETRPIKGTRPRGKTSLEDQSFAAELLNSEKDQAENVMIVDLLRNDLSRVCEDRSVQVPQLCGLESYATVHHLVSVVTGKLKQGCHAVDLLRATFPGGSITGAPKIRAMEIIAEIEPTKRGPYCGSIGYIGFNGDMDTSITIRTYAIKNDVVTFQAGGAVVVDSDPLAEYEETLVKARALMNALANSSLS